MTSVEEDKVLKLKSMSSIALNTTHLIQQNDTMSSSLLCNAHFGKGLPTIQRNLTPCDPCIFGKNCKQNFLISTSKASRKLGLIHSYLCGPMHVATTNGNKYILTFINDYSRMCWVYLLRDKSKAFYVFKNFIS